MDSNKVQEYYIPPPKLTGWESFKLFVWNSEKNEFLGRGAASWGKIGVFYLVFYAALAGFFAVMLVLFYQTLDDHQPRWLLDANIIGTNPGMGFRPMPDSANIGSTLIWFKSGTDGTWHPWVNRLEKHLENYNDTRQEGNNYQDCDWNVGPSEDRVCAFRLSRLQSNCSSDNEFGYQDGSPCVLIKLNKIYGWEPEPYTNTTPLPDDMPRSLKDRIAKSNPKESYVWISCEGENPADKENIGTVMYLPAQGFPTYYFPYVNRKHYLSPIVMVKFLKPAIGIIINVECRAWSRNIKYNKMERRGAVHFELLTD